MERIYDNAKDKNVAAVMIYGDVEGKAYVDEDCTIQFKTSELKDAFIKRALIKIGNDYFIPTGFSVASEVGEVAYVKDGSPEGSAATATLVAVAD